MKTSQMFLATQREAPADAEIRSHQLMLRAGLMRQIASGIYSMLPLGLRSLRKIEAIVREEMDRAGALELLMPALLPAEFYQRSGRWEVFGDSMFRLKDRGSRDFCLGPTHEEFFASTVKGETKSYRSLPLILYQIQTKYRDERRPRFGLIRSREFIMKDAYSFDRDDAGLDVSYNKMYEAYTRIFTRCGLDFTSVQADSGAMGGSGSQEFMVKSDIGEDTIVHCDSCGYAANSEKAESVATAPKTGDAPAALEEVATPDVRTIDDLCAFFSCSPQLFVKTLIYSTENGVVAALVRGDRELNEVKLKNLLDVAEIEMAGAETVAAVTGAQVGFAGPVGLKARIVADKEVQAMANFVTGANKTGFHLKNVNMGRDFEPDTVADIRTAAPGDACVQCGSPLRVFQGIEVGHVFKLGTKYSTALGCVFQDDDKTEKPMIMGSYGIGVNRTLAAVVEQRSDDRGIVWPMSVAPYQVYIVPVKAADEVQMSAAEGIYEQLLARGIEAVLDDRTESAGVKFNDADLMGIPIRITLGRKAGDGIAEIKLRSAQNAEEITIAQAADRAAQIVAEQLEALRP